MMAKQPTVLGIPKSETIWVTYTTRDGKAQKLGKAKNPIELEKYIHKNK